MLKRPRHKDHEMWVQSPPTPQRKVIMSSPMQEYLTSLPLHEKEMLLDILEVASDALILTCDEKSIYEGLRLALWKTIKLEEPK